MASKLKWKKIGNNEWRAGPFQIVVYESGIIRTWINCPSDLQRVVNAVKSLEDAKNACERLAQQIVQAMES